MSRVSFALLILALLLPSLASAQVIYAPVEENLQTNPYPDNPYLTPHQARLLYAIMNPRVYLYAFDANGNFVSSIGNRPYPPDEVGLDRNGSPLYIRKRDLLPQERPTTRPAEPAQATPLPEDPNKGQIIIRPYRPSRPPIPVVQEKPRVDKIAATR